MAKRRSSRVTWFPALGSQFLGNRFTSFNFEQLIPELSDGTNVSQGNGSLFCTPLTRDYTAQAIAGSTASSLRDYVEGQDYILRRIVGSIFLSVRPSPTLGNGVVWDSVLATCGFLVARAEEVSQIAVDLDDIEVDPQAADNIANPWIWRRSWMLGNPSATGGVPITSANTRPVNNMVYGGGMSGPFIDSKIARRITKEHRLWFAGSCLGLSDTALVVSGTKAQQPLVNVWSDLRILGSMRRGKNLSTF